MQDFTLNRLFFLDFFTIAIIIIAIILNLNIIKSYKILSKKTIKQLSNKDLPIFYSTYALKHKSLCNFFKLSVNQLTNYELKAIKNIQSALKSVAKDIKKTPHNYKLLLLYAKLNYITNNTTDFLHIINQIKLPFFCSRSNKARYYHLLAASELHQTDMLSASAHCSKALRLYQKKGFAYEEAECYLTLAQIYRISGVFDVAFTMLNEAKKIFTNLNIPSKIAETEAYFGLTELGRENYSTATDYLQSAVLLSVNNNLKQTYADTKNWLGLCYFLENKISLAIDCFNNASKSTATLSTLGFSSEMLARIYLKKQNYAKALKQADIALINYQQTKHKSGIFENLYLKAEIFYLTKKYSKSKEILTELIKQKTPHSTTYYPANAYTLLGLINLKEQNTQKAKTLFKQAVDLEHSQNRLKGAAIDYNNLAEISFIEGQKKEAETYLSQALNYAIEIEDKELINYLQNKLLAKSQN